jgi:acetyl esterase/lipase
MSCKAICQERVRVVYKRIDTVTLHLDILHPVGYAESRDLPALVFFHGGSWKHGSPAQLSKHAEHFAKRGAVCFLVEYRVSERHGTTPYEALKDAKSAMRHIRSKAGGYRISPNRIIGVGGSAGGHLAAASALIDGFDESGDDLSVSCKPDALVLFNPVIDTGPEASAIKDLVNKRGDTAFSPLHNIRRGAPPTILFFGTKDKFIPVETAKRYKSEMDRVGVRCDLLLYEGQPHGFFNVKNPEYFTRTLAEADRFLVSLGAIKVEGLENKD